MANAIPEDLLQFIDANVESVEQLEILRVLGETPAKQHRADELALECQIQPTKMANQLASLEQRGLIKTQIQEPHTLCSYGPSSADKEQMLQRLLQCYKERPVTLIKLVYDRVDKRLKAFADAFKLRQDS